MIEQRLLAFTLLGAGWVLWLLVALSVLSVTVMLERGLYFAQRRMSRRFPELLRLCEEGLLDKAAQLAAGDAMEAEVVRVAARVAPSGQEAVEKAVASTIDRRRLEYERWLFVLGTLGNNAPFIGLLGTVLGIIRAFHELSHNAAGGATVVMGGISEALVATAIGLFAAIPAVVAYNRFSHDVDRLAVRFESFMEEFSNILQRQAQARLAGAYEAKGA